MEAVKAGGGGGALVEWRLVWESKVR